MYKTKKEAMVIKKFKQKSAKNIEVEGDRKAVELEIDHLCVNLRECSMVEFRPRMDSGRVWLMKKEYVIYSVRLILHNWWYIQLITLWSVQALTCLGFSLEKQVSSPKEHKEKCNIYAFVLLWLQRKASRCNSLVQSKFLNVHSNMTLDDSLEHWMTIPKFWPKPIPRLFLWYQIFRNRDFFMIPIFSETFSSETKFPKTETETFFRD